MGAEKEEHYFVMVKDKILSQVKADIIHSFLCVSIVVLEELGYGCSP